MSDRLETPIAFFLFNRPDTTAAVFQQIARARPATLLLVADGPRLDRAGEAELCAESRKVVERIDWPCEVRRNFADENLGCKRRVSSGLDWVFSQVESAIVLEDDILPHPSLFPFLEQMLAHYRDDDRIGMVTGFNPVGQWKSDRQQYHFSYCGSVWGWASWRRAWRWYDVNMRIWEDPEVRERIKDIFAEPMLYEHRMQIYENVYQGKIDTWDFQWSVARLAQSALSIVPAVNLVQNIGFRPDATHTKKAKPSLAEVPLLEMTFPLRFHNYVAIDRGYDRAFTLAQR